MRSRWKRALGSISDTLSQSPLLFSVSLAGWILAVFLLFNGSVDEGPELTGRASLESAIEDARVRLHEFAPPGSRFGVVAFRDPADRMSALGRYLSASMIEALRADECLTVLDRDNLDSVKEEAADAWGVAFNNETAPKLGELLSMGYLLSGTVFLVDSEVTMSLRITNTTTGEIVGTTLQTAVADQRLTALAILDSDNANPCLSAVTTFASKHFQWIWATLVVPLTLWLLHLLRRTRARSGLPPSANEGAAGDTEAERNA